MPTNETNQSLAPPFPGQVIPRIFGLLKTIVQRESRHWIYSMNWPLPFALIAAFSLA
jgi:hypothetical protein